MSIATFAVLVITYVVLGNWTAVTGGQNSLMGLPLYVLGPMSGCCSAQPNRRARFNRD